MVASSPIPPPLVAWNRHQVVAGCVVAAPFPPLSFASRGHHVELALGVPSASSGYCVELASGGACVMATPLPLPSVDTAWCWCMAVWWRPHPLYAMATTRCRLHTASTSGRGRGAATTQPPSDAGSIHMWWCPGPSYFRLRCMLRVESACCMCGGYPTPSSFAFRRCCLSCQHRVMGV